MRGITVAEMAGRLGISHLAVKSRLVRAKIKARGYVGMVGLYNEKDFQKIAVPRPAGRPVVRKLKRKAPPRETSNS